MRSFDPPSRSKTQSRPLCSALHLNSRAAIRSTIFIRFKGVKECPSTPASIGRHLDVIFTKRTIASQGWGRGGALTDRVSACLVCCISLLFYSLPPPHLRKKKIQKRRAFPRQNVTGSQLLASPPPARDGTLTSVRPCLFYDFMDCADVLQTVNRQKYPAPKRWLPRTKVASAALSDWCTALFQRVQSSNLP